LNAGNIKGTLTAPISGVVVRFTLSKAANPGNWSPLHLRVVKPLGAPSGSSWRGLGGSSPDVIPTHDAGLQSFPVRVPIAVGDYIGIEQDGASAFAASTTGFGSTLHQAFPALPADGSPGTVTSTLPWELLLQGRVEPDADHDGFGDESQDGCPTQASTQGACISNAFELGRLQRNRKKGIAFLFVTVPGPGEIGVEGKGVKRVGLASAAARKSLAVAGGVVKLKIRPGKGKRARAIVRKLRDKGKAKLKILVIYVPTGGTANTQTRKVKLVRR
jgi:hypothetical protein